MSNPLSSREVAYLLKRETVPVTQILVGDLIDEGFGVVLVAKIKEEEEDDGTIGLLDRWDSGTFHRPTSSVSRIVRSSVDAVHVKEMLSRES